MKYNVGDKVRIKSLDWYNENKGNDGIVEFSTSVFVPGMSQFCGKVVTIEDVFEEEDDVVYCMEEIDYDWTDEMIEGLVEESVNIDVAAEKTTKDISDKVVDILMSGLMVGKSFNLPQGYQFVDENGNVINATKIVLEKKKKEYPKTFLGCCDVLGIEDTISRGVKGYKAELFDTLQKLLICRDAYWKLYGEEMGLDGPWEPDWYDDDTVKYCIIVDCGIISKQNFRNYQFILAFPTAEMRDAFKENFDPDIKICKEFL